MNYCIAHPKFDGEPNCGFDIGICFVGKKLKGKNFNQENYSYKKTTANSFQCEINPHDLKPGQKVSISGYPADKQGYLYEHTD